MEYLKAIANKPSQQAMSSLQAFDKTGHAGTLEAPSLS
jgi:hypothetical protein